MVTVKLKSNEAKSLFGTQTGTVTYSLEDLAKIYEFNKAFDEFVAWTKRECYIYCQGRTEAYNKAVGGISSSNHLKALAKDTYWKDVKWSDDRFIKWATKWKSIAKKHGFDGEMGYYPKYQYNGCVGMIHVGRRTTGTGFYHWKTVDGVQTNKPFTI